MVLQPINSQPCPSGPYEPRPGAMPAWVAVAQRQKQCAASWWLVAQPDHAALSGDLAANFVSPNFPAIDPLIAKAIGAHDAGWAMFPPEASLHPEPMLSDFGKPRSFIEFGPEDFLRAWDGSINRAESICAAGGVMVSRHFCELAKFRLKENMDDFAGRQLVLDFLEREAQRQRDLSTRAALAPKQSDDLLHVLQFCDVLSLYLCSGATEDVEFPQKFAAGRVHLRHRGDFFELSPSPFQHETGPVRTLSLGVPARKYPASSEPVVTTLPFLLQ